MSLCCSLKLDGNIGTVGITGHAAEALGDVVYVDLPSVGAQFSAGDSFGSVESVKAASDLYAPVAGEVVEVNAVSHFQAFQERLFTIFLFLSYTTIL